MTGAVGKMAPTGVVVAVVSYCIWPYVFAAAPAADAKQAAKLPEISPVVLSPRIPPPPERNPFDTADAARASAGDKKKGPTAGTVAKDGTRAGGKRDAAVSSAALKNPATAKRESPPAADDGKTAGTKALNGSGDPMSGLMLEATCISGNQRLAAINGRIYQEGELLRWSSGSAPACVVAQIRPDKVLLECQGKTIELKYSDVASPSSQGKGPATAAKASGVAGASRPKKSAAPKSRGGSTPAKTAH